MTRPVGSYDQLYDPMLGSDDAPDPDVRTMSASKRTFEEMQGSSPPEESLSKRARIEEAPTIETAKVTPAEELYRKWTEENTLDPDRKLPPNLFHFVEVLVQIGEGTFLKRWVPRFALTNLSPILARHFTSSEWKSKSQSITLSFEKSFPNIHPRAAAYVIQFGEHQIKWSEPPSPSLRELKQKYSEEEFDLIFSDIVRLSHVYEMSAVRDDCRNFLIAELESDVEGKMVHYFTWAISSSEIFIPFFQDALIRLSAMQQNRARIWPVLLSLYEADYEDAERKSSCQAFLRDCFEKIVREKDVLTSELSQFCDCFIGLFPKMDFRESLLKRILTNYPFNLPLPQVAQIPFNYLFVYGFIVQAVGVVGTLNDDAAVLRIPVDGKFKEYQRMIQAMRSKIPAQSFTEFLALYPENAYARLRRSRLQSGILGQQMKDVNHLLQMMPNHYDGLFLRASLHMSNSDFVAAALTLDRILQIYKDDIHVLQVRASCAVKLGKLDEALSYVNRVLALNPDPSDPWKFYAEALRMKADIMVKKKRFSEAIKAFDQLIIKFPIPHLIIGRGECYRRLGKFDEAVKDFTQGLEVIPRDITAVHGRGYCYWRLGKNYLAMKDLSQLDHRGYTTFFPKFASAAITRGHCHLDNGDFEAARKELSTAFEIVAKVAKEHDQDGLMAKCNELKERIEREEK